MISLTIACDRSISVPNRGYHLFGICTALCVDGDTYSGPEVGFWDKITRSDSLVLFRLRHPVQKMLLGVAFGMSLLLPQHRPPFRFSTPQ